MDQRRLLHVTVTLEERAAKEKKGKTAIAKVEKAAPIKAKAAKK